MMMMIVGDVLIVIVTHWVGAKQELQGHLDISMCVRMKEHYFSNFVSLAKIIFSNKYLFTWTRVQ